MHLSEILNHLGEDRQSYFNAVSPPIIQSSNFAFPTVSEFRNALENELDNTIYTRGNNPTVAILRKKIAALENAEDALLFGSGSAAVAAAVIGNLEAGDHLICVQSPYSWTHKLVTKFLVRFGITHTFVDGTSLEAIQQAITPKTKVLLLESPNSMTFQIQDLEACAKIAKANDLISIIDNSYCSPLFQKPIDFGIDLSVHSVTKYLNGHSDVVAGAICGNKVLIKKIFESELMTLGGILSPSDAGLILRGLRTLELRMARSSESCATVTRWLSAQPGVERVWYPFAEDFGQLALAKKQMSGTGGLFSISLRAKSILEMEKFCDGLTRFLLAASWGGHESLFLPICGLYDVKGRDNPSLPWNLVRFYIGLEDPKWLIEDLRNALKELG